MACYGGYLAALRLRVATIAPRIELLGRLIQHDPVSGLIDWPRTEDRLLERRTLLGWKRARGDEAVKFVKPLIDLTMLRQICTAVPIHRRRLLAPDLAIKYKSIWFLLCATGNRPKHVRLARRIIVLERGIRIFFGARKYQLTSPTDGEFPFCLKRRDGSMMRRRTRTSDISSTNKAHLAVWYFSLITSGVLHHKTDERSKKNRKVLSSERKINTERAKEGEVLSLKTWERKREN